MTAALRDPDRPAPAALAAATAAATAAAAAPVLLAYNVAPSASALNQILAVALWGLWALALGLAAAGAAPRAERSPAAPGLPRGVLPLGATLALLAAAVLASSLPGTLPGTLALQALALLGAAAVLLAAGLRAARLDARSGSARWLAAFAWGWLVAGLASLVPAAVQVFAPQLADGAWIARTGFPGVAVGNLRQHNQLGSVLMLALVALAVLDARRRGAAPATPAGWGWPVFAALAAAALVAGLVLTTSRTALVALLLLAGWALLDRRMPAPTRRLLALLPLLYALLWALLVWVTAQGHTEFQGAERFSQQDMSTGRFTVWRETLQLIAADPWLGSGWGRFNLAWTLTPLPGRVAVWFDHPHNLGLHLAAELGVPLALALLALLTLALWRALAPAWAQAGGGVAAPAAGATAPAATGAHAAAARLAGLFALVLVPHTLLEYPLWFAYFLLPVAWAWGYALGTGGAGATAGAGRAAGATSAGPSAAPDAVTSAVSDPAATAASRAAPARSPGRGAPRSAPLAAAGAALLAGAAWAFADFRPVADVFRAEPGAAPLEHRVQRARASLLFGHHGDYAAATTGIALGPPAQADAVFRRSAHLLLDGRLLAAWAEHLHAVGRTDLAAGMAARLLEFRGQPQAEALRQRCAAAGEPAPGAGPKDPGPCPGGAPAPPWRAYLAAPP